MNLGRKGNVKPFQNRKIFFVNKIRKINVYRLNSARILKISVGQKSVIQPFFKQFTVWSKRT